MDTNQTQGNKRNLLLHCKAFAKKSIMYPHHLELKSIYLYQHRPSSGREDIKVLTSPLIKTFTISLHLNPTLDDLMQNKSAGCADERSAPEDNLI